MTQIVWVVEPIGYDEHGIMGVFESLEAAKASQPDYEWEQERDDSWVTKGADVLINHGYAIYEEPIRG